jgi:hypothetical protein
LKVPVPERNRYCDESTRALKNYQCYLFIFKVRSADINKYLTTQFAEKHAQINAGKQCISETYYCKWSVAQIRSGLLNFKQAYAASWLEWDCPSYKVKCYPGLINYRMPNAMLLTCEMVNISESVPGHNAHYILMFRPPRHGFLSNNMFLLALLIRIWDPAHFWPTDPGSGVIFPVYRDRVPGPMQWTSKSYW